MEARKKPAGKPFRHELKYIIDAGEHAILSRRLRLSVPQDAHAAANGGEYRIRSLYFDDPYDSAVEEKIAGIEVRDKYRIRIYNGSDSAIKLERKHKQDTYIKKDSLSLTRAECEALLAGRHDFLLAREEPFARQMYGTFKTRLLRPKVLVDYVREPYVFPVEDVRVTFDKDVRTAMRCTDLFNENAPTYPVWELKNCMILEVKFNNSLPQYIQMLLQVDAAQRAAASKYLYCRKYEF